MNVKRGRGRPPLSSLPKQPGPPQTKPKIKSLRTLPSGNPRGRPAGKTRRSLLRSTPARPQSFKKAKVIVRNPFRKDVLYEVERILGKREINGKIEYLLKWEGYPQSENSWQPIENITLDIVAEYERDIALDVETFSCYSETASNISCSTSSGSTVNSFKDTPSISSIESDHSYMYTQKNDSNQLNDDVNHSISDYEVTLGDINVSIRPHVDWIPDKIVDYDLKDQEMLYLMRFINTPTSFHWVPDYIVRSKYPKLLSTFHKILFN